MAQLRAAQPGGTRPSDASARSDAQSTIGCSGPRKCASGQVERDSALFASPRETFTPQFDDDGNQIAAVDFAGKTVRLGNSVSLLSSVFGYEFVPIGTPDALKAEFHQPDMDHVFTYLARQATRVDS